MNISAKCALFCLLGLGVGIGGTVAVVVSVVTPKFNKALDDDQITMTRQREALDSSNQALIHIESQVSSCNAELLQRNEQVKNQAELILNRLRQPASDSIVRTVYNSSVATIIFEPTNQQLDVHLSIGLLRGLNLANLPSFKLGPQGQLAPHWVIPAKVIPVFIGDSRGAVYYFFENGNLSGPITPFPVPQQ
jgi:hypothetical protein